MKAVSLFLFLILVLGSPALAEELELPARAIISPGENEWDGETLQIKRGRGSMIGWYISAREAGEVTVSIEYTLEEPLNQEYQISFDGQDRFWEVPVTEGDDWSRVELGAFRARPGLPILVLLVPPSNRKYDHALRFRRLILTSKTAGNLMLAQPPEIPATPDAAPGFGTKLDGLHPALVARDLRGDTTSTLR